MFYYSRYTIFFWCVVSVYLSHVRKKKYAKKKTKTESEAESTLTEYYRFCFGHKNKIRIILNKIHTEMDRDQSAHEYIQ